MVTFFHKIEPLSVQVHLSGTWFTWFMKNERLQRTCVTDNSGKKQVGMACVIGNMNLVP